MEPAAAKPRTKFGAQKMDLARATGLMGFNSQRWQDTQDPKVGWSHVQKIPIKAWRSCWIGGVMSPKFSGDISDLSTSKSEINRFDLPTDLLMLRIARK